MISPASRNPSPDKGILYLALGGVVIAGLFYGILQIGHHLTSSDGTWLTGNPFAAIILWVKDGADWTITHTVLAVIVVVLMLPLAIMTGRYAARQREFRESIDYKARLLGAGKSMTLKSVTAKNSIAKYTSHASPGMFLAKLIGPGIDLYADWRSTVVAIMGTGSGKTTALAIPFAWNAPGWLYATSNKRDLSDPIIGFRSERGTVRVFDPQNIADTAPTWLWNPLSYVTDDVHARILANLWADATSKPGEHGGDAFFAQAGRNLAANLLLAAACAGLPVTQCVKWVTQPDNDDPVDHLQNAGWDLNVAELRAAYDMVEETKRGVFGNAATVFSFLINRQAVQWVARTGPDDVRPEFDPHQFVRSSGDTLISLSKEGVGSLGPLIAALTTAVMEAAEDYAKTCPGGRLPVPGVFVLDEAANVVRIQDLPDKYSHYASRALFILTILQSRAQGEAAWGKTGIEKLLGAATHRIYGRGIDDEPLLRALSSLVGPYDQKQYSSGNSSGKGSSRSTNMSYHSKPILDPSEIHALPEWRALIFAAGERPVLAELMPYFSDPKSEVCVAVEASKALYGPSEYPFETYVPVMSPENPPYGMPPADPGYYGRDEFVPETATAEIPVVQP